LFLCLPAPYYISELKEALQGANVMVAGVSSFGVDWVTENILPVLPKGVLVVSITKGMLLTDSNTLQIFPHHFASKRPDLNFVAIGGPCISFEMFDRRRQLPS